MMMQNIQSLRTQRGAALITGLIFLVILTLISVSAIKSTSMEERMAGNARDQDMAFQSAEAALRDGLRLVAVSGLTPSSGFVAGCANGFCMPGTTTPIWKTIADASDWDNPAKTLAIGGIGGSATPTTALADVAIQPRYIIELVPSPVAPTGESAKTGTGTGAAGGIIPFRITAHGWGYTQQAQATVQSAINY